MTKRSKMLPDQESVGKQSDSIISTRAGLSRRDTAPRHKTRCAPPSISWACAVDLSKRDWKSVPPCSQAILMADRILSAMTINFDGRRLSGCGISRYLKALFIAAWDHFFGQFSVNATQLRPRPFRLESSATASRQVGGNPPNSYQ
jgi:hypothetical protein